MSSSTQHRLWMQEMNLHSITVPVCRGFAVNGILDLWSSTPIVLTSLGLLGTIGILEFSWILPLSYILSVFCIHLLTIQAPRLQRQNIGF